MPYIVLVIYLALSLLLQLFLGNFPVNFFAFPLNLILAMIWYGLMFRLFLRKRNSIFVRFMLSPGATFWSIFLFIDACVVIGLTGTRTMTTSWVFIAILFFLQTVLFFIILSKHFQRKNKSSQTYYEIKPRLYDEIREEFVIIEPRTFYHKSGERTIFLSDDVFTKI